MEAVAVMGLLSYVIPLVGAVLVVSSLASIASSLKRLVALLERRDK